MAKDLKRVYFTWLCDRVDIEYGRPTQKTYFELLGQLHSKEFVWVVPNDDNRIYDGVDLRNSFLSENLLHDPEPLELNNLPISILEIIIALSNRLEFITDRAAGVWAWQLIVNLGLAKMTDPLSQRQAETIDDVLETLIWRTYQPNGVGGLFPLAASTKDQRKEEIWYQMHHYLDAQ
jgi:hypothetical protein